MPSSCEQDAGRLIRPSLRTDPSIGSLRFSRLQPAYESLQGRPEVCPLPTPRRCHSAGGIHAVRLQGSPMRAPLSLCPCEQRRLSTNRTRVRKRYTCRTTCLVSSFDLAPLPPTDRLQQCQSPCFDVSPK